MFRFLLALILCLATSFAFADCPSCHSRSTTVVRGIGTPAIYNPNYYGLRGLRPSVNVSSPRLGILQRIHDRLHPSSSSSQEVSCGASQEASCAAPPEQEPSCATTAPFNPDRPSGEK